MDDLTLQVGEIDLVTVNDTYRPHPCCGQIEGRRRTEAARPYDEYLGLQEFLLAFATNLFQDDVSAVPLNLLIVHSLTSSKAVSTSPMRSAVSSMPAEMRINPSSTPSPLFS